MKGKTKYHLQRGQCLTNHPKHWLLLMGTVQIVLLAKVVQTLGKNSGYIMHRSIELNFFTSRKVCYQIGIVKDLTKERFVIRECLAFLKPQFFLKHKFFGSDLNSKVAWGSSVQPWFPASRPWVLTTVPTCGLDWPLVWPQIGPCSSL